jgi:hypothetical protein
VKPKNDSNQSIVNPFKMPSGEEKKHESAEPKTKNQ